MTREPAMVSLDDAVRAVLAAVEFGDSACGVAPGVLALGTTKLYPGAGAVLHMTPGSVSLLAAAYEARSRGGVEARDLGHGVTVFDYAGCSASGALAGGDAS